MTRDSHKLLRGKVVICEVSSAIGTKLHRRHVSVFVGGRSLINIVTRVDLVSDYVVCIESLFFTQMWVVSLTNSHLTKSLQLLFLLTSVYGFFGLTIDYVLSQAYCSTKQHSRFLWVVTRQHYLYEVSLFLQASKWRAFFTFLPR